MRIQNIIKTIPILALLCSCQSETPKVITLPEQVITVRAFLPESENTRSHVTYGNTEIDRELFRWHPIQNDTTKEDDYIAVFNVSKSTDYVELNAVKVEGNIAVFQSEDSLVSKLKIEVGDTLFVNYWAAEKVNNKDIYKIELADKPQPILKNPYEDSYMTFMQGGLKMYDIVTAVEDGKIPDVHFKHLSAIMRVTFHNETGSPFNPKEFKFEYPGTESFFSSYLFFSLDPISEDGSGLKIHPDFNKYSDITTTEVNNYTAAGDAVTGEAIPNGESYDLYLCCVPRIANKITGSELKISLEKRLSASKVKPYEMTLNGFDVPIEAGKRYWFNITATPEDSIVKKIIETENGTNEELDTIGKLMLTNEWLNKNQGNSEQSSSGD